ncbi:MAG: hypothetical protein AAF907_10610, partial [Planctomycetota bacterium]
PVEVGGSAAADPGVAHERGVYVTALTDFTMTSLGIEAQLNQSRTLFARVYEATGLTRGTNLVTSSLIFSDAGQAFYDVPIAFDFEAGEEYYLEVDFAPATGLSARFFDFDPNLLGDTAFDAGGVLSVVDGGGLNGDSTTTRLANFRVDVSSVSAVPEPTSLGFVFVASLLGCGARGRKRRNARAAQSIDS